MTENPEEAFIQMTNQNLGIVHRICGVYFSDDDEKKDVIQEMMYQLWKSYPGFNGRSKFSTWMYRVCLNTAMTYSIKQRRAKKDPLAPSHHQIPDEAPGSNEESIQELYLAISSLSPLNKAIVLLYLEDLGYEEIAHITGLSKSNVSVRLVRIKRELEAKLKNAFK